MTMAKRRKKHEGDQRDDLLDAIDFKGLTQQEIPGQGGLLKQLTGRVLPKALEAEMTGHPGYEKHDKAGDRNGAFEPGILPKYRKRAPVFNGRIISMYSFGMTNWDIKSRLEQVYNAEVSSPEMG